MVGFLAHKPFFIVHLGEAREPLEFGWQRERHPKFNLRRSFVVWRRDLFSIR